MATLQKEFKTFHDKIKLGTYDENETLRKKRDLLTDELKEKLQGEKVPDTEKKLTFTKFDQGSYAMNTGIKPKNGDFDIDVGIIFDITNEEYDSNKLKKLVCDKLKRENRKVLFNRPCITIEYSDGYHVDLAIYANNNEDYHIAWGKENSKENREWYKSEPKKLKKWVADVSSSTKESEQFRRCVRYLKNWKEKKFSGNGNISPPSIGLTIQARNAFRYQSENDLLALINIVRKMKGDFSETYDFDSKSNKKAIKVLLPVEPYKDIYYKMTLNQTDEFYKKVDGLLEVLEAARDEKSNHEASKLLRKVFDIDSFPLVEDSRASNMTPIVSTGYSA